MLPPNKLTQAVFRYSKSTGKDRCSGCFYFDASESECELYERLQSDAAELFKLDESVKPDGWCSAYTAKANKPTKGLPLSSLVR